MKTYNLILAILFWSISCVYAQTTPKSSFKIDGQIFKIQKDGSTLRVWNHKYELKGSTEDSRSLECAQSPGNLGKIESVKTLYSCFDNSISKERMQSLINERVNLIFTVNGKGDLINVEFWFWKKIPLTEAEIKLLDNYVRKNIRFKIKIECEQIKRGTIMYPIALKSIYFRTIPEY